MKDPKAYASWEPLHKPARLYILDFLNSIWWQEETDNPAKGMHLVPKLAVEVTYLFLLPLDGNSAAYIPHCVHASLASHQFGLKDFYAG
jgi:hypothetical protein